MEVSGTRIVISNTFALLVRYFLSQIKLTAHSHAYAKAFEYHLLRIKLMDIEFEYFIEIFNLLVNGHNLLYMISICDLLTKVTARFLSYDNFVFSIIPFVFNQIVEFTLFDSAFIYFQ